MQGNERLQGIVDGLARALHDAVRELRITEDELWAGLRYLNEVGERGEFPLLSDVLGVSVLVDAITHGEEVGEGAGATTASNVEGPFYRPGAPVLERPYRLAAEGEPGERLRVSGRVTDDGTGEPVGAAELDAWQSSANGVYDNQDPSLGEFHLRGRMAVEPDGSYEFRTVVPPPYEIPKDGPVGALLRALGRHAFRPAHLHLKVRAPGYRPLTTMLYFADDPYLDSDAIGAVKDTLVVKLERDDGTDDGAARCRFDIALQPASR